MTLRDASRCVTPGPGPPWREHRVSEAPPDPEITGARRETHSVALLEASDPCSRVGPRPGSQHAVCGGGTLPSARFSVAPWCGGRAPPGLDFQPHHACEWNGAAEHRPGAQTGGQHRGGLHSLGVRPEGQLRGKFY